MSWSRIPQGHKAVFITNSFGIWHHINQLDELNDHIRYKHNKNEKLNKQKPICTIAKCMMHVDQSLYKTNTPYSSNATT